MDNGEDWHLDGSYENFLNNLLKKLKLEKFVNFKNITLTDTQFFDPKKPIDILFSDATDSGPRGCIDLLRYYLPKMNRYSSIFIDRSSTIHHAYLVLEQIIKHFQDKKIPACLLSSLGHEEVKNFERLVYTSKFTLIQLTETEKAKINTLSPYALTKWMSEKMIMEYAEIYKFPAISLRFFNVYGPRSTVSSAYSSVISVFLKQKLSNKSLTIVGDGLQSRSFIYVSDVVNSIIKAARSNIKNEIFNVGSQKSVKIIEIAKLLKGKKVYIPKRLGDPRRSHSNIIKIKKKLNWKPRISIKKGIKILLKKASQGEKIF